jgi:hypothetical protein
VMAVPVDLPLVEAAGGTTRPDRVLALRRPWTSVTLFHDPTVDLAMTAKSVNGERVVVRRRHLDVVDRMVRRRGRTPRPAVTRTQSIS